MQRVLVCAATRAEHEACARGIRASARGGHESLLTGVGPVHAARSLAERLARGPLPDLVISSGFAGAVSADVTLSSWVTARGISEWDGVASLPVEGVTFAEGPAGLVRCEVLSSRELVSGETALAQRLRAHLGAAPVVVDMESAALAREAVRRGICFAVVRLVSDTPERPLPAFLSPFAAAMAATTITSRLTFAGQGLRRAVTSPRGVAQLVSEGRRWLQRLEHGWRELAIEPRAWRQIRT